MAGLSHEIETIICSAWSYLEKLTEPAHYDHAIHGYEEEEEEEEVDEAEAEESEEGAEERA